MPKATVLVVADKPDIGERLVKHVLPKAGYQAHLADRTTSPPSVDAVLVDVTSLLAAPLAGLRAQRRMNCQAPALLVAARMTEGIAADMLPLGVRGFVMKPADDASLLAALNDLLEKTALEQSQQEVSRQLGAAREALDRRLNELSTLSRIGRAIAAQDDLEVMLARIVEAGVYLTRAEEGALFLVDEESGELTMRAEKNIGEKRASAIRVPSSDSTAAHVQRTGKPILRGGPQEREQLKVKTGYLVKALVSVPIVVDGETTGVLSVYNHGQATFEESDQSVLVSLADFVAIALSRVKTINQLESRIEALRKGLMHAETMHAPVEALTDQVRALLDGQLGPLTKEQTTALHRIRTGMVRLKEIANAVRELTREDKGGQGQANS